MEDEQPNELDEEAASAGGRALPRCCESCGGSLVWESIEDQWGERWLGVCTCGRFHSFFPDRRHPEELPPDPLTMFLQGHRAPRRPPAPPWIRLFLQSLQLSQPITWRHDSEPCSACSAKTTFGLLAWPRPYTAALCTVCLNCGWTATSYTTFTSNQKPEVVDGRDWTPPCPAVQRLRRCVFGAPADEQPKGD